MRPFELPALLAFVAVASTACESTVRESTTSSSGAGGASSSSSAAQATTSGPTSSVSSGSASPTSGVTTGGDPTAAGGSSGEGAGDPTGTGGAGAGEPGTGGGAQATACIGLDYCDCVVNAACRVVAEDCFCPCGEEPCERDCRCDCGGGAYLGCAPTSITNPGALEEGVWLIGWSGGANHFSWVRFGAEGELTMLDGAAIATNLPYWDCNGPGAWVFGAQLETVVVSMPGDCAFSPLTFGPWLGDPTWPEGALQAVTVVDGNNRDLPLTAYRFPAGQCALDMSVCDDPFGF